MDTAVECLQFAVRFAQMDLDSFADEDWLKLRTDLAAFLGVHQVTGGLELRRRAGVILYPGKSWTPEADSEAALRDLQSEVRSLLGGVVGNRDAWQEHEKTNMQTSYFPPEFDLSFHAQLFGLYPPSGSQLPAFGGTVRDLCILTLLLLLAQAPPDRVLRCSACGMMFYREGKRKYCSPVCTNRVMVRRHRQSEKVRKQEAERSRKRYQKRVRKGNNNLKVGRGPRNAKTPRKP